MVTIFLLLFQDRKEEEKIYDIRVCHKGKEVSTKGFFDTEICLWTRTVIFRSAL